MAEIVGIDNMTIDELHVEVAKGGRFVQYIWCISVVFMTFKRGSDIYFLRADESSVSKGLPYTFLTFFLGWWGIPWGPIYSLQCLGRNLSGGYDLTDAVFESFAEQTYQPIEEAIESEHWQDDTKEQAPEELAVEEPIRATPPVKAQKATVERKGGNTVIRR